MRSVMYFEVPYGLVVPPTGMFSVMGTVGGSPYTVAEELNTILKIPALPISSAKIKLPQTLLS